MSRKRQAISMRLCWNAPTIQKTKSTKLEGKWQASCLWSNPKLAWKKARWLEAGLKGHCECPKTTLIKDAKGSKASNNCEAADNASKHFQKGHNRSNAPVDFSVLKEIEQRQTLDKLDKEPTMLEIIKAIVKVVRSDGAPGESGMIRKCLKHCSGETIKATQEVIKACWNDEQENPQWRVASLAVTHKGKGVHKDLNNQQDLNNHQGVALQDLMLQLLSSILSKRLLDGPITLHGTQTQFRLQTKDTSPSLANSSIWDHCSPKTWNTRTTTLMADKSIKQRHKFENSPTHQPNQPTKKVRQTCTKRLKITKDWPDHLAFSSTCALCKLVSRASLRATANTHKLAEAHPRCTVTSSKSPQPETKSP
jgi:hypothetical protein